MKKRIKILGGLGVLVILGTAYYAISPLFRNIVVDEIAPEKSELISAPVALIDTPAHPASGTVSLLKASSQTILRYENLKTINGPDLYIYLSTDLKATEFVNLGKIKATEGNVNYEIPAGTDLGKYRYVLVWCEQFGVLFNHAEIGPK